MCSFDLNAGANRNVNDTVAGHKSLYVNFVGAGFAEQGVLKTPNRKSSRDARLSVPPPPGVLVFWFVCLPGCRRLESHNVPQFMRI